MFQELIQADYSAARRKTAALAQLPGVFERQVNRWAAATIRHMKIRIRGGGGFFKREPKEIAQRLDYRSRVVSPSVIELLIGTGRYIGRPEVVYAAIQEHGGDVFPKTKRALTIPFPGVRHTATMYRSMGAFIVRTPRGRTIIAMRSGKKGRGRLIPLFLLSTRAHLPARHWFSATIAERRPELDRMIKPETMLAEALNKGSKT